MNAAAEADRQRGLLQALRASTLGALPAGALALPGRHGSADDQAGLRAYRANAQAMAERALAAAYPVLARWLGDEAMAALARDLWRHHPPVRGDLALFGAELAAWLPRVPEWADMPYLADLARLEWAVHRAHTAADPADTPPDLQLLAGQGAEALRVRFVPGSTLVDSRWPVLTLWRAHQGGAEVEPDLRPLHAALDAGLGEAAWVWRRGHRIELAALSAGEAAFHEHLLAGATLGPALAAAHGRVPTFGFEPWLLRALREGWLDGLTPTDTP